MRRKTLSDIGVEALKPRAKRYAFPDPELRGHYIRVMPSGVKSYVTVSRDPVAGKQIWHTIGSVDAMEVEEARSRARSTLQRIRDGLPAHEPVKPRVDAFKDVADAWIKRHVKGRKLRSQAEIERCLNVYVRPKWDKRDYVTIRRGDITSLLDAIEDENGSRQADAVLAVIRGIANWYASRHDDYTSPFTRGMRRQAPVKRDRVLSDDEVRTIWRHAEKAGTFGAIIRMALLTAQRRDKIAKMRWEDLEGDVWVVPVGDREKGAGGTLKLPAAATLILNAQPRIERNPFVFAGRGDKAFSGFSKCKAAFDKGLPAIAASDGKEAPIPGWTIHDLRRTARSLMSRAGVRPDIAERVLGHLIEGVEGIYDRHRYDDEKANALRLLSALIEGVVRLSANITLVDEGLPS